MDLTREEVLAQVEDLSAAEIVKYLRKNAVTFEELRKTEVFYASKQKEVKKLLAVFEAEDTAWDRAVAANTVQALRNFMGAYPNSAHKSEAAGLIAQAEKDEEERDAQIKAEEEQNRTRALHNVIKDINKYTPDGIQSQFGDEFLHEVCRAVAIDYNLVVDYDEPPLQFNDLVPQSPNDIPAGFTDVFFWGIPSSGKTCALSAILNTISKNYTIDDPAIGTKYGAKYRNCLAELFVNDTGYLPPPTRLDRTQYMPFRLKKRGESDYRNIAFFELSGEVFKFFDEIVRDNASTEQIAISQDNYAEEFSEEQKREHLKRFAFKTLDLLLHSNNQKVHFFFIDYNQAVQKRQKQAQYLSAAATYFRERNDIFRRKTDAVYIIVTKADEIKAADDKERAELAAQFLIDNFGAFMDVIKTQCEHDSVRFKTKIFSIGSVYFSRICKINRLYSDEIIKELLLMIKPARSGIFDKMRTTLNR